MNVMPCQLLCRSQPGKHQQLRCLEGPAAQDDFALRPDGRHSIGACILDAPDLALLDNQTRRPYPGQQLKALTAQDWFDERGRCGGSNAIDGPGRLVEAGARFLRSSVEVVVLFGGSQFGSRLNKSMRYDGRLL